MRRRQLTTFLALILFLMAGLTNAATAMVAHSAAEPMTIPMTNEQAAEPCPKMTMENDSGATEPARHSPDDHQCNLECNCCPGSCSSSVALISDQGWRVSPTPSTSAEQHSAHPQRDITLLLRPPIST